MSTGDYSVMSGENFKKDLPRELVDEIGYFLNRFKTEYDCYNFLYKIMEMKNMLDLEQCNCRPILRKIISKSDMRSLSGGSGKYKRSGYALKSNKPASKFTGGSGRFVRNSNITDPIPSARPKELIKHRDLGVFAECTLCKHKYYVTSKTPFHKKSSPLRSLLILFLVAEYYDFDKGNETHIMSAYKFLQSNKEIGSTISLEKNYEFPFSVTTLYTYKDIFTAPQSIEEYQGYEIRLQMTLD